MSFIRRHLYIFITLLIIFGCFLAAKFSSKFIYGFPLDSFPNVWFLWWVKNYKPNLFSLRTDLLSTPFETVIGNFFQGAVLFSVPLMLLNLLFGEIAAVNVYIFLSFALSLIFTFLLVYELTKSAKSAFFAGVVYSFSQYHFWQALAHLDLASVQWLPLFLFFFLRFEKDASESASWKQISKSLLLSVLSFAAVFLTSFYLGYFAIICSCILVIFRRFYSFLVEKTPFLNGRIVCRWFLFVMLAVVLTFPGTSLLVGYRLGKVVSQGVEDVDYGMNRNTLSDLLAFGARPWDYFAPSIYHPVFGNAVRSFYQNLKERHSYQFWSPYLPERMNYLTVTAFLLAVYAVWKAFTDRKVIQERRKAVFMFSVMAAGMFFVSMPAFITIRGVKILFPSFFLFKIFPMFRVYARAGIFVLLAITVLAGFGLEFLLSRVKGGRTSLLIVSFFLGAVLFENLNFPPFPVLNVRPLAVYEWLRDHAGDAVVIEYPKDNSKTDLGGGCPKWLDPGIVRDYNPAYEIFYQRVHRKKIFGYKYLEAKERSLLGDLSDPRAYEILSQYGVDYVIVHIKEPMIGIHPWPYPQENPIDECWRRRIMPKPEKVADGFELIREFDDAVVYKLTSDGIKEL